MRALAFSVHVLTACGAALALLALLAAARGDWPLMFLWLGVALVVDAIDGPLARAANVSAVKSAASSPSRTRATMYRKTASS